MSDQTSVNVTEVSQVGEARRIAGRLAKEAGFGETEIGRLTLVATELGNNLVRYARNGRVVLQTMLTEGGAVAEAVSYTHLTLPTNREV